MVPLNSNLIFEELNNGVSEENFHFKLPLVSRAVSAILVFIDGGPKNFDIAKNLRMRCLQEDVDDDDNDGNILRFLNSSALQSEERKHVLFIAPLSKPQGCQCLVGVALYRGEWDRYTGASNSWFCKSISDPSQVSTLHEKETLCFRHVVATVPSLHKYCPRIFPSVTSICNSLSSNSLPLLKKKFLVDDGLAIRDFTTTLFQSLYIVNPKILDPFEASYTVAMLEEMFCQIDFNGDGVVDWEEFTTFCIFTGLLHLAESENNGNESGSDEESVRYVEDTGRREKNILTHTALISNVTHVPQVKRLLIIQKKCLVVNMVDDQFNNVATLDPTHLLSESPCKSNGDQLRVYAVCYIPCKDLYAFSSSDYAIVICKEIFVPGVGASFSLYRRISHTFLHVKLCWCESSKILLSVSRDNIIYGWSVDAKNAMFEMSRHNNTITDIIPLDNHEMVGTCSLDKRILLWSQRSQRVKAVLRGHKRGVRVLSSLGDVLLSAGFECDAKTWDLVTREEALTLRGHRAPIAAAKMMTAVTDCHRAITVDDNGEFRLWDVLVKNGYDTGQFASTIHVFSVSCANPLDKIVGLALPFETEYSVGYYSNVITCSSSLVHFKTEVKVAEFVAPTAMCYSEVNGCVITAIGHTLRKYDMFTGTFQSTYDDLNACEVICFLFDKDGRRIFVGNSNGQILVVNFMSGQLVQAVDGHQREVSSIQLLKNKGVEMLYSGSIDGQLRLFHMISGVPALQHSNDHAMSDAISRIIPILEYQVVLATTLSRTWGLFHAVTLKRIFLETESNSISGLEILDGGGLNVNISSSFTLDSSESKNILTFALAISTEILIISIDLVSLQKLTTHRLMLHNHAFVSNIACLEWPENSVNYSRHSDSQCHIDAALIATTDEGKIYVWDVTLARIDSLRKFGNKYNLKQRFRREAVRRTLSLGEKVKLADISKEYICLNPMMCWNAHSDVILNLAVLSEHGCFVTNSLDGYLYLWNLQQACLGFMVLPNLDSKMKKDEDDCPEWKFSMEKIPVSSAQEKVAEIIVGNIRKQEEAITFDRRNGLRNTVNFHHDNSTQSTAVSKVTKGKKTLLNVSHADDVDDKPIVTSGRTCVRTTVLKSLNDQNPLIIDTSPLVECDRECDDLSETNSESSAVSITDDGTPMNKSSGNFTSPIVLPSPISVAQESEVFFSPVKPTTKLIVDKERTAAIFALPTVSGDDDKSGSPSRTSQILPSPIQKNKKKADSMWKISTHVTSKNTVAFTENSIRKSMNSGVYGSEERKILRNISRDQEKIEGYARVQPQLLLKNSHLSTSVKFPVLDVSKSEINFGAQKAMFKNANKHLSSKNRLSAQQTENAKHSICRARIEYNVNHAGPMILEAHNKNHDIELPSVNKDGTELPPPPPTESLVNTDRMKKLMEKVEKAKVEAVPAWESRASLAMKEKQMLKKKKQAILSQQEVPSMKLAVSALELKLFKVIERFHAKHQASVDGKEGSVLIKQDTLNTPTVNLKKPSLKPRDLMPSYKMVDVNNFLRIFCQIDRNYSGVLDINEWAIFFTTLNTHVDQHYAKLIFYQMDDNGDGVLSINELLPLIFTKSNKDQLYLIEEYLEYVIAQQKMQINHYLTAKDLQCLFDHYDTSMVGYVSVDTIRKKIINLRLPRMAHEEIMFTLKNIDLDEMFSEKEFSRIFKQYISRPNVVEDCID